MLMQELAQLRDFWQTLEALSFKVRKKKGTSCGQVISNEVN